MLIKKVESKVGVRCAVASFQTGFWGSSMEVSDFYPKYTHINNHTYIQITFNIGQKKVSLNFSIIFSAIEHTE